jgi:twitching motility protein PilI
MANREALRELQSRLASRLQAARTEARQASWLAVECGGQGLLFPLATAGEIFPLGTLLPVPHTQPWFVGVANLRGGLHGVVDLAAFLGLRPTPTAQEGVREQTRLLALNPALGSQCALLVERLAGLRGADALTAEPEPAIGEAGIARPAFAGPRWRDARGRIWQEIDLAALALNEQFLGVAA